MTERRPNVIALAGPNGAGKSTVGPELIRNTLGVIKFVDADLIARGLSPADPARAALAAGRAMLQQLRELAASRTSFAYETTLASRTYAPWIRQLRMQGWLFHVVFLWLPSADLAVERVLIRARLGGHPVPEEVVRRRYAAGLQNFFSLYRPLAETWQMYDNSDVFGRLIAAGRGKGWPKPLIGPCGMESSRSTAVSKEPRDITEILLDHTVVQRALRKGVRKAILSHQRAGQPLVLWRNGRIEWVEAGRLKITTPRRKG